MRTFQRKKFLFFSAKDLFANDADKGRAAGVKRAAEVFDIPPERQNRIGRPQARQERMNHKRKAPAD
jgi:hypothetical protein